MAKILIVDDSAFMRDSLKSIVEEDGHVVVGMASSGEQVLDRYRQLKPDLITLDIVMHEMNGMMVLKAIKQEDPGVVVVMVTAIDQKKVHEQAAELGVAGFITKPFDPEDIKLRLKQIAQKSPQ